MDFSRTGRAIFPPIGAWIENRSAQATGLLGLFIKKRRLQFPVQWQNRNSKVLADQRMGNALDAGAGFPTIVQQQAVAVNIVAALMHKPLDSANLLIGQLWY